MEWSNPSGGAHFAKVPIRGYSNYTDNFSIQKEERGWVARRHIRVNRQRAVTLWTSCVFRTLGQAKAACAEMVRGIAP